MWKLWAQANIVFLLVLLAALVGVSAINGRQFEWPAVAAFGAMAALPFGVVSYMHLVRYHRERVRKHLAYWAAMQEIVDELARQSLTEVSVFFPAFERGDDGETMLVTSSDNPNHSALRQMADLGVSRLISTEASGETSRDIVTLRYGFDFKGMGTLFSLVEAAAKRREFFEKSSQLDVNGAGDGT